LTTRFSLAELADMLHVHVSHVRQAVDVLAATGQLTAESFQYAEKNWRIAPSDTKVIQDWILEHKPRDEAIAPIVSRKIVRKTIKSNE